MNAHLPLDPSLKALLDAERSLPGAPAGAKDRSKARLGALLGPPVPPDSPPDGGAAPGQSPPSAPSGATGASGYLSHIGAGKLIGALIVGAGLGSAATHVVHSTHPGTSPPVPSHPIVFVVPSSSSKEELTPLAPAEIESTPGATSSIASTIPPKPSSQNAAAPSASTGGLAEERAILDEARSALGSGRYPGALEAAAQHQKRFPGGQLSVEREAIAVQALARSGQVAQARARARAFRQAFPRSVLLPVVWSTAFGSDSALDGGE